MKPRAQFDISFHWIFVLIAGVFFLAFFFFAARSCAQTGEYRASAFSLRDTANFLSTSVWQERSTISAYIAPTRVSCVEGAMYLSSERDDFSLPLDRVPVFSPPVLGGQVTVVTTDIVIEPEGVFTPSITVAGASYALSEANVVIILEDGIGRYDTVVRELVRDGRLPDQVRVIGRDELPDQEFTPLTRTIAIASFDDIPSANLPSFPADAQVYWVFFRPPAVSPTRDAWFYTFDGTTFSAGRVFRAADPSMQVGAVVAGTFDNYRCGFTAVSDRARHTATILSDRVWGLSVSPAQSPLCQQALGTSATELDAVLSRPDDQFLWDLLGSTVLKAQQKRMIERGCAVIG